MSNFILVPGDGPWRQMELVGVSAECISSYAMWRTLKVSVCASQWGNFTSFCAQASTTCATTVLFGANALLLSLEKAAQWHICAVPRAFSSLGIPALCHMDVFLSRISGEQSPAPSLKVFGVLNKYKNVTCLFRFLNVKSDEQLALFIEAAFIWDTGAIILLSLNTGIKILTMPLQWGFAGLPFALNCTERCCKFSSSF